MAFAMNKTSVVEVPKDMILDGVVIKIDETTWREIISPDKIAKFDSPDEKILVVHYSCLFENKVLEGKDNFRYFENPMTNSKLGRFLVKYEKLEVEVKIKVVYDGDGFPSIKIK